MMKKLKCALLLLLAFCMLTTGCGEITMPPDNGDTTLNESGVNNGGEENGDPLSFAPNVTSLYRNIGSVVKLKSTAILDGFYKQGNLFYVILEGIVIEDCYGKIEKDTVIRVAIRLSHIDENIDPEKFEEDTFVKLLREYEYFYVYTYNGPFPRQKIYSVNRGYEYIESFVEEPIIDLYEIIPISDGKVNLDCIDKYVDGLQEWVWPRRSDIVGFDDLFYDGQTEEEFEKNIKKLYDSRNDK